MSQSGYTPILIYGSSTASNVPLAANLTTSASGVELAINAADGKLYYKNSAGVVTLLASSTTVTNSFSAGTTGLTPNTATTGAVTLAGTLATTNGGTGLTAFTANQVFYASSTSAFAQSANLTFNGTTLTANTIGAFTLGGTVAGAGNQINNVVIGASSPLAGSFTTLTTSGVITDNGGTANGVTYLNSSKVVTSGSAFVFDGTNVGIGVTNPSGYGKLSIVAAAASTAFYAGSSTQGVYISNSTGNDVVYNSSGSNAGAHVWQTGNTERMRLDSSGNLLVGTTTASGKLTVAGGDAAIYGVTVGRGAGAVSNNTAVGASALVSNTTGSGNTASGYQALYSNTTGTYNTASGASALYSNTTGANNTASGASALYSNTTGSNNVASGLQALSSNTTGVSNTAVGFQAGYSNTTGVQNVAIGQQALYTNSTANNNTALGTNAGFTTTGGANVFMGINSGYSLTTGVGNTFVGSNSASGVGYYMTTGSKNSIFGGFNGNQGGLDIRTASNYIVLSDGDGNPRGIFDNNGNLLVGTTTSSSITQGLVLYGNTEAAIDIGHVTGTTTGANYSIFRYNGTAIGSITQSGTTAVLFNVTSDQRLKENIQDAASASTLIDSLQVRQYDWKTDNTHQRYGFIAQELVTVAPEAVHQPTDPEEMMAVDYSKLVPMLVKEIQSLRKRLTALEST